MPTTEDLTLDPAERLEDAEYDLALARRAASGRSLEAIGADLEAARIVERAEIKKSATVPLDEFGAQSRVIAKAQVARFDLVKERDRALAVQACEAAVVEARREVGCGR